MVYYFYVDDGILFYAQNKDDIPSHITNYQTIETDEPQNYIYKNGSFVKIGENDILENEKQRYIYLLKKSFDEFIEDGYMFSQTINKHVNLGSIHLRNVESLIQLMQYTGMQSTLFRCYDNSFVNITLEQLNQVKFEMIAYGLQLYAKKWEVESTIMLTTSLQELYAMSYDFKDYLK